jgi:hypothetical protein
MTIVGWVKQTLIRWVIVASLFAIHLRLEFMTRWFVMTHQQLRELDPPYVNNLGSLAVSALA